MNSLERALRIIDGWLPFEKSPTKQRKLRLLFHLIETGKIELEDNISDRSDLERRYGTFLSGLDDDFTM